MPCIGDFNLLINIAYIKFCHVVWKEKVSKDFFFDVYIYSTFMLTWASKFTSVFNIVLAQTKRNKESIHMYNLSTLLRCAL